MINDLSNFDCFCIGINFEQMTVAGQVMPIIIIKGKREGPVFVVSSLLHHDELVGPGVVFRLLHDLDIVENLKGILVLIPFMSHHQMMLWRDFETTLSELTSEEHEKLKLGKESWNPNRFFPGKEVGDWLERFCFEVMTKIIRYTSGLIDLHCCRMIDGCFSACNGGHEASLNLAKAVDLDFVDTKGVHQKYSNTMYIRASEMGVASILMEIPGVHELSYQWAEEVAFEAVKKGLIHLNLLPGNVSVDYVKAIFCRDDPTVEMKSIARGYFKPVVNIGQRVKGGDTIGYLNSLETFKIIQTFQAPFAGACASLGPASGHSLVTSDELLVCFKKSQP